MASIPQEARIFKDETREKVRRGIARLCWEVLRDSKKEITIAKVRAAGGSDQNAATTLLRLWRAGELSLAEPWVEEQPAAAPVSDLAEKIRAARTDGDREELALEIAARVGANQLDPDAAATIKGLLSDARASAEKKRQVEPAPEDPRKLLLASEDAMKAARAIDWMVSDARRDRVLAFVAAELEADIAECPNTDKGGAA